MRCVGLLFVELRDVVGWGDGVLAWERRWAGRLAWQGKRCVDVVGAALLLLVALPLWPAIALPRLDRRSLPGDGEPRSGRWRGCQPLGEAQSFDLPGSLHKLDKVAL